MKIFIRNPLFFFMTAIALLFTVTCVEETYILNNNNNNDDGITYGPVNLGDKLNVAGEQVWMPNYNTGKVSQMLLKFEGDRTVDIIVEVVEDDGEGNLSSSVESVGSGKIEKGILSFKVEAMDDSNLLDSDDLLLHCFNEWYYDEENIKNIAMTPNVKGNIITLVSLYKDDSGTIPAEGIIREGFSGTNDSLTGGYIYYIYVKKKCRITAGEVKNDGLKYKFNELNLSLEAGWNTILKSEKYTTTGDSSYSMEVKNPSIKWVMQKIKSN